MRLLVVVQRYGADIAGGSERVARELARRLAQRGNEITVATSRARSYVTWADELPAGESIDEGVRVLRFDVSRPRDPDRFTDLQNRVLGAAFIGSQVPLLMQESWIRECGPLLVGLNDWIDTHHHEFDAAILFTFQFASAWCAADALRGAVPVVLHPTAHPELTLYLDIFSELFAAADGVGYLSEEEQTLVERRGGVRHDAVSVVCGTGIDPAPRVDPADIERVRHIYALGQRPYAVCVGRIDTGKGTDELVDLHRLAASVHGANFPALVMVGEASAGIVGVDDHVRATGFVPQSDLVALIAGAVALVQPSPHESFSLVLCEAWALGRPVLVTHRNDVLVGQVARSGGGLVYRDLAEYAVMLEALGDPTGHGAAVGAALGANGRRYVDANYRWDDVIDRYERFLAAVMSGFHRSPTRPSR
jgi:glycosyltransferase involved in cell wall biosynthesis